MSSIDPYNRLRISLGAYDQIVAYSQDAINSNLKVVHDRNDAAKEIHWASRRLDISLDGYLLAPSIAINPKNVNETTIIRYIVQFGNGSILQIGLNKWDLGGWQIAGVIDLLTLDSNNSTNIEFNRTFLFSNDFSIERLYFALLTAPWMRIEFEDSFCVLNGERVPMDDWVKAHPNHGDAVPSALKDWGTSPRRSGLCIKKNSKMCLPEPPQYQLTANEFYPFWTSNSTTKGSSFFWTPKATPRTDLDDGKYNCLLFCVTMAGLAPPKEVHLPWSGNFAMPENPRNGMQPLYGTLALHSRIFFEEILLPELQPLCRAIELIIGKHTPQHGTRDGRKQFWVSFDLLDEPQILDSKATRPHLDSKYIFERVEGSKRYTWNAVSSDPENGGFSPDAEHRVSETHSRPFWLNKAIGWSSHMESGKAHVEVEWIPGTSTVKITGWTSFSLSIIFTDTNRSKTRKELPWQRPLNMSVDSSGQMTATIETDTAANFASKVELSRATRDSGIEGNTRELATKLFKSELSSRLSRIIANLQPRLAYQVKTKCSNASQWVQAHPFFTEDGHLLADVTFRPRAEPVFVSG